MSAMNPAPIRPTPMATFWRMRGRATINEFGSRDGLSWIVAEVRKYEGERKPQTPIETPIMSDQKAGSFQMPGGNPVLVSKRGGVLCAGGLRVSSKKKAIT